MFRSTIQKNPVFIIGGSFLLLAIFLSSRAFIIGCTAGIIFLIAASRNFKINKQFIFAASVALLLLSISLVVFYKPGSSLGRWFIYKISFHILKENFLTGIGIGRFEAVYGSYQAAYFKSARYSTEELLLADNTYYAFNDYFQLIIECGITGIVIVVLYIAGLIKLFRLAFRRGQQNPVLLLAAITIIAISVAAFFTHLLEKTLFQCLLATSIAAMVHAVFNSRISWRIIVSVVFINLLILFFNNRSYILNYQEYQEFREAKILYSTGSKQEALNSCKILYPALKKDPDYLVFYGDMLADEQQYGSALQLYKEAALERTWDKLLMHVAWCYYQLGDLKQAELQYLDAVYLIPNRFTNRYALFNFYYDTHQKEKAIGCGYAIMHLPVKIYSSRVVFIKKEVEQKLNELKTDF